MVFIMPIGLYRCTHIRVIVGWLDQWCEQVEDCIDEEEDECVDVEPAVDVYGEVAGGEGPEHQPDTVAIDEGKQDLHWVAKVLELEER